MNRRAERLRTATASQPAFLPFFALASLPCVSKAASFAPKTNQKISAERCEAVFSTLLFLRQRKFCREYPLVFPKDFLKYWEKQVDENLSGLKLSLLDRGAGFKSTLWQGRQPSRRKGETAEAGKVCLPFLAGSSENICRTVTKHFVKRYRLRKNNAFWYAFFCRIASMRSDFLVPK